MGGRLARSRDSRGAIANERDRLQRHALCAVRWIERYADGGRGRVPFTASLDGRTAFMPCPERTDCRTYSDLYCCLGLLEYGAAFDEGVALLRRGGYLKRRWRRWTAMVFSSNPTQRRNTASRRIPGRWPLTWPMNWRSSCGRQRISTWGRGWSDACWTAIIWPVRALAGIRDARGTARV